MMGNTGKAAGKASKAAGLLGPLGGALSGYFLGELISKLLVRASGKGDYDLQMAALASQDKDKCQEGGAQARRRTNEIGKHVNGLAELSST